MSAMPSSKSWFSRMLALSLAVLPATAHAQSLPKGYASDELPSTPAPAKTASPPATPPPEMKGTVTDTATATGTAQISTSTDEYEDTDPSALTDFREPLQGYGTWVADDTYGTVWVPDTTVVGADFAPYQTGGYWTLTDDGDWLWVSTYDWGYVPFHYGRWIWISSRGWAWIPGRVYAPAWVTWRVSDYGYIGWAPLPPLWYWSGTRVAYFGTAPVAAYVFCPTSYVFHTSVHSYVVKDRDTVKKVAAHSRSYKAASPTATKADHKAAGSASASKGGAAAIQRPKGPSMKEAGVPDVSVPKKRGAHDSRAEMFSKKSTTANAKTLVKKQRAASVGSAGNASSIGVSRAASASSSRAGSSFSTSPGVVRRSGPGATAGQAAASSQPASRGSSTSVLRTPTARGGSSAAASAHRSPSRSVPRASAPAARPSAPAVRAPTPSRSSASPSRSSASPSRSSASPSRSSASPSRSSGSSSRSSGSRGGGRR